MRGRVYEYEDAEQALREWTATARAAYRHKQNIERMRWEREVLAPAQERILEHIQAGELTTIELPQLTVESIS